MQAFRKKVVRLLLTFITGMIFLNMGFFLMEVRMLGLHNDRQMMENISKMLAGAAFEEERDVSSASTNVAAEEYLAGHHSGHNAASLFLIAEQTSFLHHGGDCSHGYYKKFNPPPEV